jgi:uncharacterized protein (DUF433 family)
MSVWREADVESIQSINLIAVNPAVRKGRPYIVGTTVTVADVAMAKIYHGQDADGIAEWYGLSLPQVYAALSYYYDHKDDIDEQIRSQIRRAETLKDQALGNEGSLLSG